MAFTFQRDIFAGDSWSPQFLFNKPLFDIYDVTELVAPDSSLVDDPVALQAQPPEILYAACQTVTHAITFDNDTGTVTFHLANAYGPFLTTLASFGYVMDKDWLVAQGAWDGDCATWQNTYSTAPTTSPIFSITNGTGPFMLDYWTSGSEVALERNPHYWRSTPIWPGSQTGAAALERVLIKKVPDAATRHDMLMTGAADLGYFIEVGTPLSDYVLLHYASPGAVTGTLQHPTGTLRAYAGVLDPSATDAFFTYNINTDGVHNYTGSGVFDGNGIPPDFFTDIHVRKAFNYAFNWTQYIADSYNGQAIQRTGPIIKGVMGHSDTQPTYFYSPTLAMEEFSQAWNGQVISSGFAITLSYNSGNLQREQFIESLKAGIEGLSPNFQINKLELPWMDYLPDLRDARIPIFISSWIQDIPHPYNWVQPYLIGTYALRQRLPDDQLSTYLAKVNSCLALQDSVARACYEDLQVTTYSNVTDMFLVQRVSNNFVRAEIRGYFANLGYGNNPYFYELSKGPLPIVTAVTPGAARTVNFTSSLGATASLMLPAGSVTETLDLVITPDTVTRYAPTGFLLGNLAFDIQAYSNGSPVPNPTFTNPITITLHYNEQALGMLNKNELRLLWWNGSSYEDAACGAYVRNTSGNILQVPVCHLSEFALGQIAHEVYLPLALRH
ncbi:MAG: Heme-binding protein A precursor [Chloroflexi bacterium ADurb.Bin360]|nr:MAG: Heme-binding protein A precursor [Chloroflexi bacterium ADurb.Bin360]